MGDRLHWTRDGREWPNREASRFVHAAGLRWHVQTMGRGPSVLLIHGTGASTHSWAGLAPRLAEDFSVVAPDLPGHGFTDLPRHRRLSLAFMADAVAGLVEALGETPRLVVGHSAGAAILARICLDGRVEPAALLSLNGALLPLPGLQGHLFAPMARLLATTSLVPRLFAWRARNPAVVDRLMEQTGSTIDAGGRALYARLARDPDHVAAALAMMAHWNLEALERDLPQLRPALTLVAASRDRMIRPSHARRVERMVPGSRLVLLHGVGHLAHEERPDEIAGMVRDMARDLGLLEEVAEEGRDSALKRRARG